MATHDLGPRIICDDQDVVRAVLDRPDLDDLLEVAVSQPRLYGAADPAVLGRLAALLRELAWIVTHDDHRQSVRRQLERLRVTIAAQDFDRIELAQLQTTTDHVEHALRGQWPATGTPNATRAS